MTVDVEGDNVRDSAESPWKPIKPVLDAEARRAEPGETIATLSGVAIAGNNHLVVRVKDLESGLWHESLMDKESFVRRYAFVDVEESEVDYWDFTVEQLRGLCSDRELPTHGKKAELVERLENYDAESVDE